MNPQPSNLIRAIHAAPHRIVLAATGGGSMAISELLGHHGASNTVLEAVVPYCRRSVDELLGGSPDQYCGDSVTRALAMRSFLRARALVDSHNERPLLGVACSASLASGKVKRGLHRRHVAVQSLERTSTAEVVLQKGRRSRFEEEQLVGRLIVSELAAACGLAAPDDRIGLHHREAVQRHHADAPIEWQQLLTGSADAVQARTCEPTDSMAPSNAPKAPVTKAPITNAPVNVVFPGAFNPLHEGHRRMADVAQQRLGHDVHFEISIENVDKPPLDYLAMAARVNQFEQQSVWLSRLPTFVRKAQFFPGATFIVGADTIERIAAPRYYGGEAGRDEAIGELAESGSRFLVFGRSDGQPFRTLHDLALPATLLKLCAGIDEGSFRADISSTTLRAAEPG